MDASLVAQLWQHEKMKARQAVSQVIQKTINDWRVKHGVYVVLPRQTMLSADEDADVSAEITEALKGVKVKFTTVPEFSLNKDNLNKKDAGKR